MADVKWIKITTDIFDNKKIKLIESMPEGDAIIVIWFKLLMTAGNINDGGNIYFTKDIPYTEQMLSTVFNRPLPVIQLALSTFEKFNMIEFVDDVIQVSNWQKYQNVDGLEKIREQTRARVAKHREQKRLEMESQSCAYCGNKATGYDHIIATARGGNDADTNKIPCCKECNQIKNDKPLVDFLNNNRNRINDDLVTSNPKLMKYVKLCNVTNRYIVTHCNAIEEDIDRDIEIDKDKEKKKIDKINYQEIVNMYNDICISFPRLTTLSDNRKKAIKARLNIYSVSDFERLFNKAEASSFLKGANNRNWSATFDWMIKDSNMAKILDGNYDDRTATAGSTQVKSKTAQELDSFYKMAAGWAESEE